MLNPKVVSLLKLRVRNCIKDKRVNNAIVILLEVLLVLVCNACLLVKCGGETDKTINNNTD